ncbi:hypothetical protein IC619_015500 [Hazenella sp. IB182353]|uniref:hypothetical protein n=1 Tax=Polycladospora coralii TaxID=2771432 RepID=UPI001746959C|nr:hypothetical protein [Polycladospora coralii]MBS7531878.1 hypothetical protein [Polycladospora coralii]
MIRLRKIINYISVIPILLVVYTFVFDYSEQRSHHLLTIMFLLLSLRFWLDYRIEPNNKGSILTFAITYTVLFIFSSWMILDVLY